MEVKHCCKCGLDKPVSEFWKHRTAGYQGYCKPCGYAVNKEFKKKNPDRMKAAVKARYWKNHEKFRADRRNLSPEERERKNANARAYRKKNADKVRWWNKLRRHRQRACPRCLALIEFMRAHVPCFCRVYGGLFEDSDRLQEMLVQARQTPGFEFGMMRRIVACNRRRYGQRQRVATTAK